MGDDTILFSSAAIAAHDAMAAEPLSTAIKARITHGGPPVPRARERMSSACLCLFFRIHMAVRHR
jgi:hypothetical protein